MEIKVYPANDFMEMAKSARDDMVEWSASIHDGYTVFECYSSIRIKLLT